LITSRCKRISHRLFCLWPSIDSLYFYFKQVNECPICANSHRMSTFYVQNLDLSSLSHFEFFFFSLRHSCFEYTCLWCLNKKYEGEREKEKVVKERRLSFLLLSKTFNYHSHILSLFSLSLSLFYAV
jgi:hypothetical protein